MAAERVFRATLTAQLEDALRLDIIEGVLAPGQKLRSTELAERYHVSPTPLREALQRLAVQNLVEIDPRYGATVARISRDDLRDTYWLREILETLALERSMQRGDDAWRERVSSSFEAFVRGLRPTSQSEGALAGALDWSRLHREFHEALFTASGSPWLSRVLGTLYDHSERYRMVSRRAGTRDTMKEHAAIRDAALHGDVAAAVDALASHLRGTVALLESAIPEDGSDGAAEKAGRDQR